MNTTRPARPLFPHSLAALIGLALLNPAATADVTEYALGRIASYSQSSNASPTTPDVWSVVAVLVSDVSSEVQSSSLSFTTSEPVTYPLAESIPTLQQFNSPLFADYSEFMLAFPATTYTFTADRGFGPELGDVFVEEDLYCPEIPHFTADTYDRLQSIDASVEFTGTINGFTLAPGTTEGAISIVIAQDNTPGSVYSVSLDPAETSFVVPAGVLLPATGYTIGLTYLNQARIPGAGFGGGAISGAEFYRSTSAAFTTLPGPTDPCTPAWKPANLVGRTYHSMAFDPNRDQVITFGGFDEGYRKDTWAWTGDAWVLAALDGPSERGFTAMVHHTGRNSVILAGGGEVADTWEWDGARWTLLSTGGFSHRGFHAMAYDSARDRVVLFGGAVYNGVNYDQFGDTWEWDGVAWTQVATTGPSPRNAHAMAYDPVRQRTVLFGGSEGNNYLDDVWEWDGAAWTQIPATGPEGRFFHALAYDPTLQAIVLFGGHRAASLDDAWTWDGTTWTQLLDPTPGQRSDHAMAFDEARNKMIVFGGENTAGTTLADTWERDGPTWTDRTPAIPSIRMGGALAFDSARGRLVMFGGSSTVSGSQQCFSDTWEWDGLSWSLRATAGPSPRALAPMAFDSARGVTVMVGGWCGTSVMDTWEWDGATWTLRTTGGPSLRHFASIAYDAARGKTVLFGGYQPLPGEWMNDTWEWNGSTWTRITVAGPPARSGHQMTYDSARGRVILFGGSNSTAGIYFGDTWEYDGTAWVQLSPGSPSDPAPRGGHALAFDPIRGRVVLFGGFAYAPSATFFGDTWEHDGLTWTQVAGGPSARVNTRMAFDSIRGEMVLFGGDAPYPAFEHNDTWRYTGSTVLTEQPASATVAFGGTAQFRVTAVGGAALTYTWRKDGLPLNDEPGHLSGTGTANLLLQNASTMDAGAYDCVVASPCGDVVSSAAMLTVEPPACPADLDNGSGTGTPDGGVDVNDLLFFLAAFEAGTAQADLADSSGQGIPDGGVDVNDLLFFLVRFEAGC